MTDAILVLNAGSSSLKFNLFWMSGDRLERALAGSIEEVTGAARFRARDAEGAALDDRNWPDRAPGHEGALDFLLDWLRGRADGARLVGVGHRVVHGGPDFVRPIRVDAAAVAALAALTPLAPLHQPHNLLPIRLLAARRPDLPQVACFDTAFHATAPALAQSFALPAEFAARGVRRYGFHGLSYEYLAAALPELDPASASGRVVAFHLGNGASMCAIDAGRSVASTMGFTALDGLPMGTRSGALDPGVILYMLAEMGLDAAAIEDLLYRRSGLLGVSGLSSDMRALLASDDPQARFAVALFVYRAARELGSLAAALGGLDAVVFTAGIGENSPEIRAAIADRARWLGVALDPAANAAAGRAPRPIHTVDARVAAWVIPTDEELMIARHTRALIAA